MPDLERVIEGLEHCTQYNHCGDECPTCPYYKDCATDGEPLMRDALALLKAQRPEAVDAPKPDSDIGCWYDITHNYTLEQVVSALKAQEPVKPVPDTSYGARPWWFLCGNCKLSVDEDQKYCPNCGRPVKWE